MKVKNTVDNQSLEERKLDENMKFLRNLRFQHIVDINMVRTFLIVFPNPIVDPTSMTLLKSSSLNMVFAIILIIC